MEENEILDDNHIEQEEAPVEEVVEETPAETEEAVEEAPDEETPEEEFDVIKYNKEDVRIPVSERQTYLQKGYNYDKVNEKATKFESDLQRVAKFSGFENVDDFLQAVQAQEEEQRIQEAAQRMGIDPSAVKEYISPLEKELNELKQREKSREAEDFNRNVIATINQVKADERFKDFDEHANAIFEHMGANNMPATKSAFEAAYKAVTYDLILQRAEQKVLSNVAARDGKTVLSSSDKPADATVDINSMTREEFLEFEKEMSRKAAMGERVTF